MIAGPEGTPYAGGLFEVRIPWALSSSLLTPPVPQFDIFVPMQYPNTPPLVWLKTTGGESLSIPQFDIR